jgi:hypothetical protein
LLAYPKTKTQEGRGPQTDKQLATNYFYMLLLRQRDITLPSLSLILLRNELMLFLLSRG